MILHSEFGLIWTTPWPDEKDLFLKISFSRNSKSTAWNPNFFPVKVYQLFLLCTLISLVILHSKFGLICTTPWPDEKELFLKFSKIPNSRNSQNSLWKTIFFLGKLYQNFCLTLSLLWWCSILRLVWFGQLLNQMKKTFFKILFSRNSKSSLWNTNFFPDKVYDFFALRSHYTGDTAYRV